MAIRLAGYQPARGTFEEEYDDDAERILQLLNEPLWTDNKTKQIIESNVLYQKLNETILDIFNERLQERYRRRKIVRDYGLVAFNKHQLWIKSIEVSNNKTLPKLYKVNYSVHYLISDYTGSGYDTKFNSLFTPAQTINF